MSDPKWLELARAELGTKEVPGPISNATVVRYYLDAVGSRQADSVPWCAAFCGAMLTRAGKKSSGSLMAKSYLRYGKRVAAQPGALAIFQRGRPGSPFGHVTFVERVDGNKLTCIGGNQQDAVTRAVYAKEKALAFRWPE